MPFFDVSYASTQQRLMTIEATSILHAASRAPTAAEHCDGLGKLLGTIVVREHVPGVVSVPFFAEGFFKYLAQLESTHTH